SHTEARTAMSTSSHALTPAASTNHTHPRDERNTYLSADLGMTTSLRNAAGRPPRAGRTPRRSLGSGAEGVIPAGDGVEQALRVLLLGGVEHAIDRALLDDATLLHDADEVGRDAHDREVVRDEEVRQVELVLQLGEQLQDLILHEHIERRHGLIEHDDRG